MRTFIEEELFEKIMEEELLEKESEFPTKTRKRAIRRQDTRRKKKSDKERLQCEDYFKKVDDSGSAKIKRELKKLASRKARRVKVALKGGTYRKTFDLKWELD